jgi:hypothetical protein
MKSIEAVEFVARIFKQAVEEKKFTGGIDIHLDCSQGCIKNIQLALTEKRINVFEMSDTNKKINIT